ncbi:ABC transporter permease [Agarivorans sp. QJM3NY_25]|uniref:ABC transporter permease n=1 Tax=Agarivorans sp. QJM3NY_25 TaxID=3421430 RepID=UPI003D7C4AC0
MNSYLLLRLEIRRLFANRALLLTAIGGLLFYAFLYPRPYMQQSPREQQIAVVNHDGNQFSRQLLRMVDASPLIKVSAQVASIEQAQQLLVERRVGGLLVIPKHFYRDLLQDRSPALSYAGDASYFLVYSTIVEGLSTTAGTLAAQTKVSKMLIEGIPLKGAAESHTPIKLSSNPVFNANQGYLDYVLPAVFIILLHQTLLIAVGLHATPSRPALKPNYLHFVPAWKLVLVRSLLFVALYSVLSCFYLGFVLDYYQVHLWGHMADIAAMLLPFLLASCGFSMCIATLLPKRDYATVVGVISSLPIVFGCGFIWPQSAIPMPINMLADLVPAKPMVLGLLKLNQMGASFTEVQNHFTHLWLLAVIYLLLAVAMNQYKSPSSKDNNSKFSNHI